jgi:hypothetical protein
VPAEAAPPGRLTVRVLLRWRPFFSTAMIESISMQIPVA